MKANSTSTRGTYWPGLDGLRTFSFALILLHHCARVPNFDHPREFAKLVQSSITTGWISIDFFFVISGFLMTSLLVAEGRKFGKISPKLFYSRRILRIWPPFFIAIFFATCVFPFFEYAKWTVESWLHYAQSMLPMVFFVGNFYGPDLTHLGNSSKLVWPLWSLCVEEQFYIFLPLTLILISGFRARAAVLLAALAGSIMLRAHFIGLHTGGHGMWYLNTFSHLDPLMIGSLLGLANEQWGLLDKVRRNPLVGTLLFVGSCAAILLTLRFGAPVQQNDPVWIWGVVTNALAFSGVLVCACAYQPAIALFSWKPLVEIGKKTYTMYLWHYFVLATVGDIVFKGLGMQETPLSWVIRFTGSFALVYALAWLSWRYLEGPMVALKKKFEPESKAQAVTPAPKSPALLSRP